ncbi:MAG: NusG domain II-containing protein [Ruminococcaceae bacterium]|nr:NusG domain II-containing protein [Oscillospiraceae bacterium]
MRTRPTVLDLIIIIAVVLLALALFLLPFLIGNEGKEVSVTAKSGGASVAIYEGALTENKRLEFENNGIKLTVVIEDGEVYVAESSCDDRVCVHSGKISLSGQSIICAPAGIVINIGGGDGDDISAG